MKFKTNIKCGACIATVTPALDQAVGAGHWQVDLSDPARILTVDAPAVNAVNIRQILAAVGYQAEEVAVA